MASAKKLTKAGTNPKFNRGSRIVLGMVKGFYPGYDREISEVYRYKMIPRAQAAAKKAEVTKK